MGISLVVTATAGNITIYQATRAAENYITLKTSINAWDSTTSATATLAHTLGWNSEIIGYYFEVDPDGYLLTLTRLTPHPRSAFQRRCGLTCP